MGTFSKSLASLGGYMAAKNEVCEYVRHVSRPFIFCASITPSNVACARNSLEIIKREPERIKNLHDISNYMRAGLRAANIDIIAIDETPIIPIYTYEDNKTFLACKMLFDNGVYVNPVVSPATPVGQALIRTSYTATHTKEQIDIAIEKIAKVLKEVKNIEI